VLLPFTLSILGYIGGLLIADEINTNLSVVHRNIAAQALSMNLSPPERPAGHRPKFRTALAHCTKNRQAHKKVDMESCFAKCLLPTTSKGKMHR
jgi:hypothetical protein